MNDLRSLGASRPRRVPPPDLLDEIRAAGRRRSRLAAVATAIASLVIGAGVVVGVSGGTRASGGDRVTPAVPQPPASPPAVRGDGQAVAVAPHAAPQGGPAPVAGVVTAVPSTSSNAPPDTNPAADAPAGPTHPNRPVAAPSASASASKPGVQDRATVHRGLSACDVRTTPSGYCGRVTTTQATGVVTIVTEVCWSNGNTDAGTLSFDSTLETDDTVSTGDTQVWDWAQDKSFSDTPSTLTLQPGDCSDWTTEWRLPAGTPGGTYEVRGRSYANELPSGQDSWTATFTLT